MKWDSGIPHEPKRYYELTEQEREHIKKSRLLCKIRAKIENSTELDSFFAPCTWICTQCGNVNIAGNLVCVNFIMIEGEDPKEALYVRCTGSQLHTWGGYV